MCHSEHSMTRSDKTNAMKQQQKLHAKNSNKIDRVEYFKQLGF